MIYDLGIFIMGFAWGIGLTIIFVLTVDTWLRSGRRRDREKREREQIEVEQRLKIDNCGYDPKECDECHLPGDCPLCGGS